MIYCENIVKILCTWQLFFLLIHRFHNFFFHFRQWDGHNCQNKFYLFIFYFYTIGNGIATIAKTFFFFLFRQWHYRNCFFFNWPGSILGRGISVTVLPKFLCFLSPPFSFSLSSFLLNFGNTIAEILSLSSICQLSWNSAYKTN